MGFYSKPSSPSPKSGLGSLASRESQKASGLAPARLHFSECRRQEKGERCGWQRAAELPQEASQPGCPPRGLAAPTTACSLLRTTHGPRRTQMQQLDRRRREKGFFINGKTKIIGGTSHLSKSRVYSAPLARNKGLLFPVEDHCRGGGLQGGDMWVGAVSLLPSLSG